MNGITNLKNIGQICFLLLLAGTLLDCSALLTSQNALLKINRGMTKDEVTNLLGSPDYRRFNEKSEEWEYRRAIVPTTGNSVIIVYFSDNRVVGMDSFEDYPPETQQPQVLPFPPYSPTPGYAKGMYEPDFANLLTKIKNEPFKDDKFTLLKLSAENNAFSCRQCAKLMSLFPFDDEKLQVVRILAPQIADKENYKEIVGVLSFLSNKEKAQRLLGIPAG